MAPATEVARRCILWLVVWWRAWRVDVLLAGAVESRRAAAWEGVGSNTGVHTRCERRCGHCELLRRRTATAGEVIRDADRVESPGMHTGCGRRCGGVNAGGRRRGHLRAPRLCPHLRVHRVYRRGVH